MWYLGYAKGDAGCQTVRCDICHVALLDAQRKCVGKLLTMALRRNDVDLGEGVLLGVMFQSRKLKLRRSTGQPEDYLRPVDWRRVRRQLAQELVEHPFSERQQPGLGLGRRAFEHEHDHGHVAYNCRADCRDRRVDCRARDGVLGRAEVRGHEVIRAVAAGVDVDGNRACPVDVDAGSRVEGHLCRELGFQKIIQSNLSSLCLIRCGELVTVPEPFGGPRQQLFIAVLAGMPECM